MHETIAERGTWLDTTLFIRRVVKESPHSVVPPPYKASIFSIDLRIVSASGTPSQINQSVIPETAPTFESVDRAVETVVDH